MSSQRWVAIAGLLALGCQGLVSTDDDPVQDQVSLVEIGGNNQSGPAGESLLQALRVRVVDHEGTGVPARSVMWEVLDGRGGFCDPMDAECPASALLTQTDADGYSSAWPRLGTVGTVVMRAWVDGAAGSPLTFVATGKGVLIRILHFCDAPFTQFSDPTGSNSTTVRLGEPVVWVFDYADDVCTVQVVSTSVPEGAAPFESKPLSLRDQYILKPGAAGVWQYAEFLGGGVGTLTVLDER